MGLPVQKDPALAWIGPFRGLLDQRMFRVNADPDPEPEPEPGLGVGVDLGEDEDWALARGIAERRRARRFILRFCWSSIGT